MVKKSFSEEIKMKFVNLKTVFSGYLSLIVMPSIEATNPEESDMTKIKNKLFIVIYYLVISKIVLLVSFLCFKYINEIIDYGLKYRVIIITYVFCLFSLLFWSEMFVPNNDQTDDDLLEFSYNY